MPPHSFFYIDDLSKTIYYTFKTIACKYVFIKPITYKRIKTYFYKNLSKNLKIYLCARVCIPVRKRVEESV